jgi:hypothetical protein
MTAVFLGAAYWSAIGLELAAARASNWSQARIAVPAVFVFTFLTLVVSLVHLHKLHLHHDVPVSARVIAWAWLAIYALVPVLMAVGWFAQRRRSTSSPPASGLPVTIRVVLLLLAALLLGTGVALLVSPGWAEQAWPWALTPITRGAVGAWLIGLSVAAAHAWLIDDRSSLRPLGLTGVVFGFLQVVALARHGNELGWTSVSAIVYIATLVALTLVSAWALFPRLPRRTGPTRAVVGDGREDIAPWRAAATSPDHRAGAAQRDLEAARAGPQPRHRSIRTTRSNA